MKRNFSNFLENAAIAVNTDGTLGFVKGCANTEEYLSNDPLLEENVIFRANERRVDPHDPNSPFIQDCYVKDDVLEWFRGPPLKTESYVRVPFIPEEIFRLKQAIKKYEPKFSQEFSSAIKNRDGLSQLNLIKKEIGDNDINTIVTFLKTKGKKLRHLWISENNIGDAGAEEFAETYLSNYNPFLYSLNFSNNLIGEDGTTALAKAIRTANDSQPDEISKQQHIGLKSLNLHNNKLGNNEAMILATILMNPTSSLIDLDISSNYIGSGGVGYLFTAIQMGNSYPRDFNTSHKSFYGLQRLDLSNNKIGVSGARRISEIIQGAKVFLQYLSLSGNDIKDEGAIALAQALEQGNFILRKLDVSNNNIGNAGAIAFSNLLKGNTQRQLFLPIKNKTFGIQYQGGLESLDLSSNNVSDDGAIALANSLNVPNALQEINLENNKITEKGALALSDSEGLKNNILGLKILNNPISQRNYDIINGISEEARNNLNKLIDKNN